VRVTPRLLRVQCLQIELHLALVLRLKVARLQLDGHQRAQAAVVQQQVDEVGLPANLQPVL